MKNYTDFLLEKQIEEILDLSERLDEAFFSVSDLKAKVKSIIDNALNKFDFNYVVEKIWNKIKNNSKLVYILISLLILDYNFDRNQILATFGYSPNIIEAIENITSETSHKVERGETLFSISKQYGVKVSDLINKNELDSETIKPGQEILIPNEKEVKLYKELEKSKSEVEDIEFDKQTTNKKLIEDGFINSEFVVNKRIPRLELADIKAVHGIVLHRTATTDLKGTLRGFEERRVGTHFLIDYDGTIYQTASLDKLTAHILHIRSRCLDEGTCSIKEKEKIKKLGWSPRQLHYHELKKSYPYRYPTNSDAIGIEVMGGFDEKSEKWEKLTDKQIKSVKLLVKLLQRGFNLTDDDIYTHEQISYKQEGEGGNVLTAIKK